MMISFAMAPVLLGDVLPAVNGASPAALLMLIGNETLAGAMFGLAGRLLLLALQFMATAMASYMGFAALPGTPIADADPAPALATLITVTATVMIFITGLHLEVLQGLVDSYQAIRPGTMFDPAAGLQNVTDTLQRGFTATLRLSGPFVVYGVLVNFAIGITNKLTPQIPVFFISLPFVIGGGLIMTYLLGAEFIALFMREFAAFLRSF